GQPQNAEPLLRRMLEPSLKSSPAELAWARRNLALAVGLSGGSRAQKDEALALIEANLKTPPPTLEDQLVKGILLANKAERRGEAIALLEKAFKLKKPNADQEFVLAQLYEADGDWPRARTRMLQVLSKYGKHERYPYFVTTFATKLLERDELTEAKLWAE